MKEIQRVTGDKKWLRFDYERKHCFRRRSALAAKHNSAGEMGHRIAKHVYANNSSTLERSNFYVLDAQGNQISTYDHEVVSETAQFNLKERNIFGSSRLGSKQDSLNVLTATLSQNITQILGTKYYEFSNHLGNVLTVYSDVKIPLDTDNDNVVNGFGVPIRNTADYSPFGVQLDGRTIQGDFYRYGFQNQEKDDEIKGAGNSVNYTFRMHDPRVGRFFAVDPLSPEYPWNSPYAFSENRVIDGVELEGLEWKQFQELNPDEKVVALANPYDAYIVGENAKVAFKYAGWTGLSGARDGRQDAYRHAFWNSINSRDISSEDAKKFADAHETGSTSFNSKSDDYDPIATKMDLHNNWVGRQIGALNPNATNTEMSQFIKQALADGKLKMILVKDFEINGQSISIAYDKKGRPVVPKSETNLIKELNSSGYKVNTNTKDKQLVRSNHPQIKANGSANQKAAPPYGDDSNDYEYNEGSKEGQKNNKE